jgi:hypothetical protein
LFLLECPSKPPEEGHRVPTPFFAKVNDRYSSFDQIGFQCPTPIENQDLDLMPAAFESLGQQGGLSFCTSSGQGPDQNQYFQG